MLRLRDDQVHALGQVPRAVFLDRLASSIQRFAPALAGVVGEVGCRELASAAERLAREHGFVRAASIRLFLQLICCLGVEFTRDPQLPWAREALLLTRDMPELDRANLLLRRAVAYLDDVHGEAHCHTIAALCRLDEPQLRIMLAREASYDEFVSWTEELFPEKHAFVGLDALRSIYADAETSTTRYGLGLRAPILFASLAFAFGSGVLRDPAYPWVARTVAGERFGDGERRALRLYTRARIYTRYALAHLSNEAHDAEG